MLLTTTSTVEDKEIEEYLGLVTGTDIYLVGGLLGGGLVKQETLFSSAFAQACKHMKSKATLLGANAIVGINCTVSSPGNTNHIIVVVTGTAVKTRETDELPDIL